MQSRLQYLLAAGAAILALGAGRAEAQALAGGAGSADMPLGRNSAPPAGFMELCQRVPEDCLSTPVASPQDLSRVRIWASQSRLTLTFGAAGLLNRSTATAAIPTPARGPAPPPSLSRPAKTPSLAGPFPAKTPEAPEQRRARKDAARKAEGRKGARKPTAEMATRLPAPAAPPTPIRPAPVVAAPAGQSPSLAALPMDTIQAVNRRINRTIRRASDADAFGREDLWVVPTGPRPSGDCEDYVLAKRRALIEAGVAPAALSIAIVRTRRGETHAVLLVATAEGEQVLDNLSPWVLRWDEAPYQWLERQAPGQPLTWVNAAI